MTLDLASPKPELQCLSGSSASAPRAGGCPSVTHVGRGTQWGNLFTIADYGRLKPSTDSLLRDDRPNA